MRIFSRIVSMVLPVLLLRTVAHADEPVSAEKIFPALEPILVTASQQSPRMLARAIDLEIAENSRIQSRAATLPTIGGSYRLVETRDDRADLANSTRAKKNYYDLNITQPLFHWGERLNTKKIGEIQKSMAEGNYREAYRGLAQELRSKYMQLVLQKLQVRRAREAVAYAELMVKLGEKRLAKLEISEVEMSPLRYNLEVGQITVERTEYDFAQAKQSFARLSATPELRDDQIPDEIPVIRYDAGSFDRLLSSYLATKDQPTPEAVNARRQVEIFELLYQNEKTRLRPKFNLTAGANQDEQSYTINAAQRYRVNSLYAGFTINWTLFDGFTSQAATRTALARLRQSRMDAEETANRLAGQAQQQVKQIYFSARSMSIADRGLLGAESLVLTREGEFKRGVASESDVTLARIALLDARISAYNTRMDYLWRSTDFMGTLAADPAINLLKSK